LLEESLKRNVERNFRVFILVMEQMTMLFLKGFLNKVTVFLKFGFTDNGTKGCLDEVAL